MTGDVGEDIKSDSRKEWKCRPEDDRRDEKGRSDKRYMFALFKKTLRLNRT